MKTIKSLNAITVIGNVVLTLAISYVVICFCIAALSGERMIANFNF